MTFYPLIADAIKRMYYLMKGYKIMKRNIFSVLLLCLVIVSICVFNGCNAEEIEATIIENDAKADDRVNDAIAKAESEVNAAAKEAADNLAAAKSELETLIAAGAAADADAIQAAVAGFNAAIAEAEETIAAAQTAIEETKTALDKVNADLAAAYGAADDAIIADLNTTKADLKAAKEANEALADALDLAVADLEAAIKAASADVAGAAEQNLAALRAELLDTIANGDFVTAEKLSAAISKAVNSLMSTISAVQAADMKYADARVDALDKELSLAIEQVANAAAASLKAAVEKIDAAMAADADALVAAIADYNALVDAAEAAATLANNELKAELEKNIADSDKAVADKAADDLAAAVAKIDDAMAKDAAALTAAIADYNALVDAAEAAAEAANAALEAKINAAIADAKTDLQASIQTVADEAAADLAAAVATINDAMAKDAAALTAAVAEYKDLVAKAEAAANAAATLANNELKAELEKNIADSDKAVADKAAADLAAAVAKIDAAMAADADALTDAIAEYKALVAAAEAAADAANVTLEEKLNAAIDAVDAKLQASIQAVADKAAADLAAAVKALEDKLAANSDNLSADLVAAVEELEALVAKAEAAAEAADTTIVEELNIVIENSAKEVADAATKALDDAKLALEAEIADLKAGTAADLEAAKSKLEEEIDLIKGALDSLSDTTDGNFSSLTNAINDKIAADIKEAQELADKTYIIIDAWNEATEMIIEAMLTLNDQKTAINVNLYYAPEQKTIDAIFETYRIKLYRAVNPEAVNAILAGENSFVAAVAKLDTKADIIYTNLTKLGSTVSDVVYGDAWLDVLDEVAADLAAEIDPAVVESLEKVTALYDELRAQYNLLAAQMAEVADLNNRVDALIAAIADYGYTAVNKAEYEAIIADVAAWDKVLDDAAAHADNYAAIERADIEKLTADYTAAIDAYVAYRNATIDKLDDYAADTYVYNYTADGSELAALEAADKAYAEWLADVLYRGFNADVALLDDLYADLCVALARANALEAANTKADEIEALVEQLSGQLTNMSVVKSEYQDTLNTILAEQAAWIKTYFDEYSEEKVAGNANYDILDHAAIDAVKALYDEKLGALEELENNLAEALTKIETIDIYSADELAAASAAYTALTNKLGDLGYKLDDVDASAVTNTIATKTVEYKALVKEAVDAYKLLTVLAKADVTLAKEAEVDALVAWYNTYLAVDVKDADAELPVEELELADDLVITAAKVADAKAAYAAFVELTAAKAEELAKLEDALEALVDKTPAIALRAEIAAVYAQYNAWLNGDNAPEGYKGDVQFVPVTADVDAIAPLKAKLDTLDAAVKNLVKEAADAYKLLTVLAKADVTLAKEIEVNALVDWYNTYLVMDIKDAATELAADIVLEDVTITAAKVADAKAAYAAFVELTAAKDDEFKTLKAELEALVDKDPSTALRDEITTAYAHYDAWLNGEGRPDTYNKEQFIPVDPSVLDVLYIDLVALDGKVEDLETRLADIKTAIGELVVDYKKLATLVERNDAKAALAAVKSDIEVFTADNDDVYCFADYEDVLDAAQLAIDIADELATFTARYDALKVDLDAIADANVKNSLLDRAGDALAAAEAAVLANDAPAKALATANFDLFDYTVEQYNLAIVAAGADETLKAKVYELYVLLDNHADMEVNTALATDEAKIANIEEQLGVQKKIVEDTFDVVINPAP